MCVATLNFESYEEIEKDVNQNDQFQVYQERNRKSGEIEKAQSDSLRIYESCDGSSQLDEVEPDRVCPGS
jgi:hypothetical protein